MSAAGRRGRFDGHRAGACAGFPPSYKGIFIMKRYLLLGLLCTSLAAHAATSLRVNDKVLTIGDTAARVVELLGQPTARSYIPQPKGISPDDPLGYGEQWQYVMDGKTEIITIVYGKVTDFQTQYH